MLGVSGSPVGVAGCSSGLPPQLPALASFSRTVRRDRPLQKVLHYAGSRVDLYRSGASRRGGEGGGKKETSPSNNICDESLALLQP